MIGTVLDTIVDQIYPSFCANCNQLLPDRNVLCEPCVATISPIASLKLSVTKKHAVTVYSCGRYDGVLKKLILGKFHGSAVNCMQLAQLMADHIVLPDEPIDLLIPVPQHWTRSVRRGLDHLQEMTSELSLELGIPNYRVVTRTKRTALQSSILQRDRGANVADAFAVHTKTLAAIPGQLTGKHVAIVDDLVTTGSTLVSLARQLLPLGVRRISALVAARAK